MTSTETGNIFIDAKQFVKKNKKEDLCFTLNDSILMDDVDEYIDEIANNIGTKEDCIIAIKELKQLKVYKKVRFKLSPAFLFGKIADHLADNYSYDPLDWGYVEDMIGEKFFDRICKKFNKNFSYYISGDFVCYLDLSKNLKNYCEDYLVDEITITENIGEE